MNQSAPVHSKALPIPLARLIAYALPALPLAVLTLPLYIIVPTYYAAALGVPLAAVGQALLLVRIVDAISDPIVGILADRSRPRFGRRRTWFLGAVPITVAAVWLVFVPAEGAGALWLFGFGVLLSLGATAILIPYWAWGAEMATGYAERNRVVGIREVGIVLGTLVATATPALAEAAGVSDEGQALLMLAVFVAVALPATAIFAVVLVPEPKNYSRGYTDGYTVDDRMQKTGDTGAMPRTFATRTIEAPISAAGGPMPAPERARSGMRLMWENGPFVRLLAAFVLNGIANGLPATLFLFFVSEHLQAPDWAGILLFTYFLIAIAGVPLWLKVSNRFGKHRTWCGAMLFNCAAFATVPLLGPGDTAAFLAICIFTGLALGADLVLPSSIQADVIDVDTAAGGIQRTGTYVAAWGLGTKLALALAVGIAFPVLDASGFQASGGLQSESGLIALVTLYAGVPVIMKLAAIALMWRFPLDAAEQALLRARIEARAAA